MKKVVFLILLLVPFKVLGMSASSMIAMDLDNDVVYYEYNADDRRLIASITNIMTTW